MNLLGQRVTDAYRDQYGEPPAFLVRAPGRVNLIGDHTDYNEGFVLPMAIDRAVWLAGGPRMDGTVHLRSLDFDAPIVIDLADFARGDGGPAEYVKGVARALLEADHDLSGMQGVLAGDVPIGAGLSSSAALEMAVACAFVALADRPWEPRAMARAGQWAENAWVGVNSGIMDQLISAAGVAGHALLIDCRSLEMTPVPLPEGTQVVVLDTNTRRGLVGSEYNTRRAECDAAAAALGVAKLRDVSPLMFAPRGGMTEPGKRRWPPPMDPAVFRRARHVVTESERTSAAAEALAAGDAVAFGRLMNASHASMRDDFENSTPAMDAIVAAAQAHAACYGARMTGGGWGGGAVALVDAAQLAPFCEAVAAAYEAATGITPTLLPVQATDGAAVVG
jgi:galactokinase